MNFSGKVVLVACGTSGLGHTASLAFLSEGAEVTVNMWRGSTSHQLDLTDPASVDGLIEEIVKDARPSQ